MVVSDQVAVETLNPKRILIIGASGFLGSALAIELRDYFEVYGTYLNYPLRIQGVTCLMMDSTQGNEIVDMITRIQPDVVLYCAGLTNTDAAQLHRELSETLNLKAPTLFFKVPSRNFQFVYFSCDQVMHAALAPDNKAFTESDAVRPINAYAQIKSQAETVMTSQNRGVHCLRLGSLYGEAQGPPHAPKRSWVDWLGDELAKGRRVKAFEDQVRSFTYIGTAAKAIRVYLERMGTEGQLLNLASKDFCSRYEFARTFAKIMGYDENLVNPVSSAQGISMGSVARPQFCGLDVSRFESRFNYELDTWRAGLKSFADRLRLGQTGSWTPAFKPSESSV
jgi:dTDP-4-dehydrorhamnose reductase